MARKAKPPSPQLGLTLGPSRGPSLPIQASSGVVPAVLAPEPKPFNESADLDLDSFDDYDDSETVDNVARLRLADPPKAAPRVIVEATEYGYEVSRLRHNGTTVACVSWTRSELEELIMRATSALEI